ncbi:hypothetical protein FBEOM_6613 [Fusarium beomiforme]|uniref:Ankyrin n=1 Tax=Fusarium beomiforme TaxID=44412 RepID=A0A9P5DVZ7_9HYPO|nr:hypothetical protein FBEOM_6613 [Fusarium beomiforme]
MADPLSLAASIAGLISLADLVFKTTYKFVRAAKDAKDEIQSLVDEVNNLASVLRRLEALTSDLEDEGQSFDPTLRNHYLNHCYKTFNRIELRVKKASESFKKSKLDSIVRQLKWPFSSSETKELLAELSRHKETISVALLADSMRKIQTSLSKSDEIDKKVTALGEVARRIEINTTIAINDRKKRILDHFMKANPQPALQTSIRLRHSMTGLWLTESPTFIRWLETPGSKLWLTGIPGAGKTILAGSVIQEALSRSHSCQNIGAAFFFCDYKEQNTWNIVNIFGALASQLARQNDESYNVLDAYYESLYPPEGLPRTADTDDLRAVISRMCEIFDQTIIVVDGLDECDDMTDEVVDNLIQLADYSEGVSIALFSRDHYDIRVRLEEDFEPIQIAAHTEDVQLYVNAEVDKRIRTRQLQLTSADMKEEIRHALVGKADGMFRWVVCQLDYLCNCAHDQERREALSKLPPDLPESYRRLLERVNNCSIGVQNMVQMCLHFMAVAEPKLTIVELRQAVSISAIGGTLDEGNTVPENELMKRCSSLIRKSTDGRYFEFAHFSVREFLEDKKAISRTPGIEKYWIAQPTTNALLASQCLRFLQMKNFDKIPDGPDEQVAATCQRDKTYPFYKHAALLWIKLTRDGLWNFDILELAKSLFQPSKRAYFLCWAIEIFKNVMFTTGIRSKFHKKNESEVQAWRIVTTPSFQPLHMAAALNLPEICSFLISSGSDVNDKLDAATPLDLAFMTGAYHTDWGTELGLILWNWALECDFPLTQDLSLVGSYGLISDDALVSRVLSAVCSDNVGLLKYCFEDRRLRNQVRYSGPVDGLLQLAVEYKAFAVFKALVTAGFDPYTHNDKGNLPIHLCERKGSLYPFKIFKELGISLISQDKRGYNILHYWAQDSPINYEFLTGIGELDIEEMIKGLQARTIHGDTPLSMVFENAGESPRREHCDIDLDKICLQVLGFLQKYHGEKGIDTRLGADQSIFSRREVFSEFKNMIRTDTTPLHKLKPWVSLSQVQLLTQLYPDAVNSRRNGRLPLERYILNTLNNHHYPDCSIILKLFPDSLNDSESYQQQSLWSFACCLPESDQHSKARFKRTSGFETMINIIFLLGAMRTHEEKYKESGLKPLLANYQASLMPTIQKAILQTKYWDGMQSCDSVSLLFQDVIKSGNLDMIRFLMENRADLYHRVNGQSPFDIAFRADAAIILCNTEEGVVVLRQLLEYCNIEEIVKYSSETDNASPLHTLATSEDATKILWLGEALVQRGFDINQVGSGLSAETPLVYHLQRSSFQFAEQLLKLGADPSTSGASSLNAVLASIAADKLPFLQKVIDQRTETEILSWFSDPVTFTIRNLDQTAVINNGNALHLASACNSVTCLEFMLDQVSELDKTKTSDEGLTPVHIAAYEGFADIVKVLVAKGFDIMVESQFGYTPMHMAVLGRSLSTVQCLLEHGASQTLDASGRTPARISWELGFDEIYQLLEGDNRAGYKHIPSVQELDEFMEPTKRLAMSFERAVEEGDYESMAQLLEKGCPVDVSLPSSQGLSTFLLALKQENCAMAKWLLDEGASALQADLGGDVAQSAIEIAAGRPSLNRLLPDLFESYLREGGDLRFGYEFPLQEAIAKGNTQGLQIMLEAAEEYLHYIGCSQTFIDVLNRLLPTQFPFENSLHEWTHIAGAAAMHIAARTGNKEAISLLVNRGADIDVADSNGWTPLIYSKDADTAQHLVSMGASTAAVGRVGSLPLLMNWLDADLFDELYPVRFSRLPKEFLTVSDSPRFSTRCEEVTLTSEILEKLSEFKFDLVSEDEVGRSMMHCILCEEDLIDWVLGCDHDLDGTTPFPWHLEWCQFSDLAFLTSSFERLQRNVPADVFRKILNLEPSRGWSPLCRAAALNSVDIIAKCVDIGAEIDFEGSCFGSALMNASACGSLDAVKLLIRNGASVTYMSKKGLRSCFQLAGTEAVRRWLLSGRFRDQMRISVMSDSDCRQEEVAWSGYMQAEVLLYGSRARWPEESTLDYAKRLSEMRKSWQGKVLRLFTESTGSSSVAESDTGSKGGEGSISVLEFESEYESASESES